MQTLPVFLKLQGASVLFVGNGEGAEPKRRLLEAAGAKLVSTPELATRIAVLAIDNEVEARLAAEAAREAGLIVNAVDKPELCDFSFGAIVDRSPVMVAIGTGGASASLSKALRERFEALLPERLGEAAEAVGAARRDVNQSLGTSAERRRFWDRLMARGGVLDPFSLGDGDFEDAIRAALAVGVEDKVSVTEIQLRSMSADDVSIGELRAMSQADICYADERVPDPILGLVRRDAELRRIDEYKIPDAGRVVLLRGPAAS